MGDNRHIYGFRWSRSWNANAVPPVIEVPVASGLAFTLNGGSACDLNVGDPITMLSTGYATMSAGTENSPLNTMGIIIGIGNHGKVYDGTTMAPNNKVPNGGGVYGTNYENQTKLLISPIDSGYWECDCDDKTSYTTYATYFAIVNYNVDHVLTAGSEPKADPMLDISTAATTNTLKWCIMGLSDTFENKDFAGKYVKLLVRSNIGQQPWSSTTGI